MASVWTLCHFGLNLRLCLQAMDLPSLTFLNEFCVFQATDMDELDNGLLTYKLLPESMYVPLLCQTLYFSCSVSTPWYNYVSDQISFNLMGKSGA